MSEDAPPTMLWPVAHPAVQSTAAGVHLWSWSLYAPDDEAQRQSDVLSQQERTRAERFVFRPDWRRYILAHARMRHILSAYTHTHPGEILLSQPLRGKPHLQGTHRIAFNLTHSANLAVLAVARGMEVGVDVECVREQPWELPLGQLSPAEQHHLRSLPEPSALTGFYRCWTAKEALLKGIGVGILADLTTFSILPGWNRPVIAPTASAAVAALATWTVQQVNPAHGFVGSLATPGDSRTAACFQCV